MPIKGCRRIPIMALLIKFKIIKLIIMIRVRINVGDCKMQKGHDKKY